MSNISNKDIYEAINGLRQEMTHRIENVEKKVDENTNWRNKIVGQIAVIVAVIGFGINFAWDFISNKLGDI